MKRLNPETGKPFVRGDTRADGFLFLNYTKRIKQDGYFVESWLRPEVFQRQVDCIKDWQQNNKEKISTDKKVWYQANRNKVAATVKSWQLNNKDKRRAMRAKRKACKIKRTPLWLTKEHYIQIESVYALAKRLTDETGVLHHVDHIVPLQGEFVSGLHVPWNLRAIPATENLSKSNNFTGTVE